MTDFEADLEEGQEIEVGNEDEGFKGSWYVANVIQTPSHKNNNKLLVEFKTLMDDVQSSKPLREYVDTCIVRPLPPQEDDRFFEVAEEVEVYHNDGWWEGTITQVLKNLRYIVYFRCSDEEIEFKQSEIRSRRKWIDGRWVRTQELQTMESSFCMGAAVEVCRDDQNCRNAWFPATVLKRINNNSFLVEYQSVRLQYMVGKLKETVDSLHIRPFPPDTSQDKSFNLLEKVDAFYDCGWWSGVINRVLAGSRYIVFFKHRDEQKEFSHSELRFHMEWINGKWFINSKEISSQGQIESPEQAKSVKAGKTDQGIDMASSCNEDAAKNVNMEMSPGQAQKEVGNQSSPCKMSSPGRLKSSQAENTLQILDMAGTPSGNATKTVTEKSPSFRNSSKVDTQSTPKKASSISYTINSCKKKKVQSTSESDTDSINSIKNKEMQSDFESNTIRIISSKKKMQSTSESDTEFSRPCKKLKTVGTIKTPVSLITCHARALSTRLLTEDDGPNGFAIRTTDGQGTTVERKKDKSPVLAEMFLNCSEKCNKDHPKHLNSGQEQLKHDLESNGLRNHSLVEGCISHLPPNIIDVEQYEVVNLPKTQVPVRTMKLRIRPLRQKGEPLDIKQQTEKGVSQQMLNVYNRITVGKVSRTKASLNGGEQEGTRAEVQVPATSKGTPTKGGKHKAAGEGSQAPCTNMETQTKGQEETTPSKEIANLVTQTEDTMKETFMDGESSHVSDLPQPLSMWPSNSNVRIINEKELSSDRQPTSLSVKAITWKDSPIRDSELQNLLNVDDSSFSFEGVTADTQLGQATGDELSECVQQSFLIVSSPDQMLLENENLPFIKCSPMWENIESLEVFRVMPQQLHFRPLKQFNTELREGLAIGSMVNFASLVEKIGKTKLDDPPNILRDRSRALEDLKGHGFNVQPIQARLESLLRIKDEQGRLNNKLMEAEDKINMKNIEKINLEAEIDELNKKTRGLQEYLNQLSKKRESAILKKVIQDSNMAELKTTMDTIRGRIHSVSSEFKSILATPW